MADRYYDRGFGKRIGRIERKRSGERARTLRRLRSGNMPWLIALALSLFAGLVAGSFARITRFHLTEALPAETLDWTQAAMDYSLAFVAGVVILQMIGIVGREHLVALMSGVFATMMAFHIPVHMSPEIFALLFSVEWVEFVLQRTDPMVLRIF